MIEINEMPPEVYDAIDDVIAIINDKYEVESLNQKGQEAFGKLSPVDKPVKCYELICKSLNPNRRCPLHCLQNKVKSSDEEFIENNGTIFSVSVRKLNTKNSVKYVETLHDVTNLIHQQKEQKTINDEYNALNEEYLTSVEELEVKNESILSEKLKYQQLFSNMNAAFAFHEIILDEYGKPINYRFLDVNSEFEKQTGLKRSEIVDKTVLEILPNTEKHWIENYGKVALTGTPLHFTNYADGLGKYFETKSYSPQKGFFAVTFNDVTDRVLAKKELETKESLLQTIFNNAPSIMMLLNAQTEIIQMNVVGLNSINKKQEQVIGLRGGDVFNCVGLINNPDGCGKGEKCKNCMIRRTVEDSIKTGKDNYKVDADLDIQKNGKVVRMNLLVSSTIVQDLGSKNILVTIEDISQLKKKETALKKQNDQITKLFEGAKQVLEFDKFKPTAQKLFNFCKQVTGAKSGYVALLNESGEENEVLFLDSGGMPCSVDENLPMPIRGLRAEAYLKSKAVCNNDFMNSEHIKFMPQGHVTLKNVLFAPLLINKKAVGLIGLANKPGDFTQGDLDIVSAFGELASIALHNSRTQEKLQLFTEELKVSEEKYRALYENAPLAYQSLDSNGNIRDINPQWLNMLGYQQEEVIGKWFGDFLAPQFVPIFKERFPIFKKEGTVHNVHYKLHKKNGSYIDVSFEGCVGYTATGEFKQTYCTFKDITLEKRALDELGKSEEKYKSLYNYAGIGIGYYSVAGKIIDYNDIALSYLKMDRENVIGKHITEIFPTENATEYLSRIKLTLDSETTLKFEDKVPLPESTKWFKSNYSIVRNNENVITGVQIMSQDITLVKENELSLLETQKRLTEAQSVAKFSHWEWNIKTNESNWGDELYKIYGRKKSAGPPSIDTWQENIIEADRKRLTLALDNTIKNGVKYDIDYRILRYNNKELRWINGKGNVIRDAKGNPLKFIGTAQDVTERKEIEQKLLKAIRAAEKNEERLIIAQQASRSGTWEWDIEKNEFLWPNELQSLFDMRKNGENGIEAWTKIIHPDDFENANNKIKDAVNTCSDLMVDYRIIKPDSTVRWIRAHGRTFVNNNKATRMVGLCIDITEQKGIEFELIKEKEKAEKADRLKSAFLANMSHEIRTPLNGLMGFSEIMASKKNLTEEQRLSYASVIRKSGSNLLEIVNDILDISALENKSMELNIQVFELNTNLKDLYNLFQKEIIDRNSGVKLNLKKGNDDIYLKNDEGRFMQIFTNLLNNALKFTPKGEIEFGIYTVRDKDVVLFVKDSGIGIAPENHDLIFDRFRQAETSSNRLYGGNGLGLSITKELLHLMKGKIWLDSEVGKGTCFYVSIPYHKTKETSIPNAANPISIEYQTLSKLKILVVEDELINTFYIEEILEDINSELYFTTNGKDAIKMVKDDHFDLVLMDIKLPDINGYEATREIRKFNPTIPIIAQTAYAMQTDEQEAYNAGCNHYVSKPINKAVLFEKVFLSMNKS